MLNREHAIAATPLVDPLRPPEYLTELKLLRHASSFLEPHTFSAFIPAADTQGVWFRSGAGSTSGQAFGLLALRANFPLPNRSSGERVSTR